MATWLVEGGSVRREGRKRNGEGRRVLRGWAHSLVEGEGVSCVGPPAAVEQRPPTPFHVVEFPAV